MGLWFSASSVVPLLTNEWTLDDDGRAWLTLSVQIGFVVGTFVSALLNLSDLLPTHKLFAISAFAGALANALIPFAASDLTLALPMRFLTGVFSAGVYPVGMKIMATWTKEDRGLGIGLLVGALTVGNASPYLINGLGGFADWRPVMYTGSALAAVGGVLALLFVREGPLQGKTPPFNWKFALRMWQERGLRLANFGYFGHMWELFAMWTWIQLYLGASFTATKLIDSSRLAALVAFAVIGVGGIGSLLAGVWADRWGRTRVTIVSLVVSGICSILAGLLFDASPLIVSILTLVWGFAVVADSAQYSASVSELAPREYIGTALTLQTSLGFLLTLGSIRLIPTLETMIGWRWAFAALAIGPALGAWAMFALKESPDAARLANGRG
jgi:MFS family permease